MEHGHFSEDGKEFVITNPRTPRPWHNYLVNDVYLANLTQLGTGASFYQPRGEGLRTNVTEDRDGNGGPRFVYLRDDETGVLYIGEENVGIWRYPADPQVRWPLARYLVDVLGPKGNLSDDLNDDIELDDGIG